MATTVTSPESDGPNTEALALGGQADMRLLARNAGALFAAQAVGLIVPLLTVPYLARVLGPAGWGPVLAAQALANWMVLLYEYGFDLSGTRAVAQARVTPRTMPDVVHGIQSAKALLIVVGLPLAAVACVAIPALRNNPAMAVWAVAFAALRGSSPLWFFQGVERMQAALVVDMVTRAAAALAVFVVVHGPSDGWRVLAAQAVFAAVALAVLIRWFAREIPLRVPEVAAGVSTLRAGGSVFACRAWSGLYIQANTLIMSALATPSIVAFFGGAERIIRAAINLLQPLTQAFLPRLSFLRVSDPHAANRLIRRALLGVGLFGAAMGLAAVVGAPFLVRVLLGPGYEAAIPVLRWMGLLPVFVAVNTVLGLYWALPYGFERSFLASIVAAGITNVGLAVILVPRWGALGMVGSAIAAEIVVLLVLGTLYMRAAE